MFVSASVQIKSNHTFSFDFPVHFSIHTIWSSVAICLLSFLAHLQTVKEAEQRNLQEEYQQGG